MGRLGRSGFRVRCMAKAPSLLRKGHWGPRDSQYTSSGATGRLRRDDYDIRRDDTFCE
ncbi:hypothetical protein DPMN_191215 [Dreissena polymorpha]|uniref:Uncharacterized protein n=1 Tax=Dreissena polymorpha TaxID=45954 RepID=A0A9D3Y2V0_DREPO|nr:hypothetical protein DPMN_191215 [Dreissena polymorpha]